MDKNVTILDLSIGAHTMSSLLARFESLIERPGCGTAYALNAHSMNLSYRYPGFFTALSSADVLYADGASLLLAARVMGKKLPEKLTTTDVWPKMCETALRREYTFFLLGGAEGLARRARDRAMRQYPGLKIVGAHHGYFNGRDRELISLINEKKPDVLWVGLGEPKQAVWVEAHKHELQASLAITCGGMFKIVAGDLRRISDQWRQRGFEWVFRMVQEPRTASRYLWGLPVFGSRVLAQRLQIRLNRSQNGNGSKI